MRFGSFNVQILQFEPNRWFSRSQQARRQGAALGTELTEELRRCIGAAVFVDDLRPNVAYELGFFHGRGRTVLLLTHQRIDSVWMSISDLAGTALVVTDPISLPAAVHRYLDRLYNELSFTSAWSLPELPSAEHNFLLNLRNSALSPGILRENGKWGPFLQLNNWEGITFDIAWNLLPQSSFKIVLRAVRHGADYSIYFLIRFADQNGHRRHVWLGFTSLHRAARFDSEERTFPAQPLTTAWQLLSGKFQDVLERGYLFASDPPFYLEKIRIRAGQWGESDAKPIEIGFVEIVGVDR